MQIFPKCYLPRRFYEIVSVEVEHSQWLEMFFSVVQLFIAASVFLIVGHARDLKLIDQKKEKNSSLNPCGSFINFVNDSENLQGSIKIKNINLDEKFKLIAEFGMKNATEKSLDEPFSSFDIFEDEKSPGAILEITFGFTGPFPELVSITKDDTNLCEKG